MVIGGNKQVWAELGKISAVKVRNSSFHPFFNANTVYINIFKETLKFINSVYEFFQLDTLALLDK